MEHRSSVIVLRSNAISNNNDDEKMNYNGVIEEASEKKDEPCKEKLGKKEYLKTVCKKEAPKKTVRNPKKEAPKKRVRKKEALKKAVHKKDALKFIVVKKQAMKKNVLKKDIPNDALRAVPVSCLLSRCFPRKSCSSGRREFSRT